MASVVESRENREEASGNDCPETSRPTSAQGSVTADEGHLQWKSNDKMLFANKASAAGGLFQKQSTAFGNKSSTTASVFNKQPGDKPLFKNRTRPFP
eukprot:m.370887 g.370887  ORF g.370887 m.370887 type:complete len:97 (+) comp16683_c0_seq3:246-536(+)